jgi:WD40 repeat protein
MTFSADGTKLAVAVSHGVILLDGARGVEERFLAGDETQFRSVAFLDDRETVVALSGGARLFVWNAATGELLGTLEDRANRGTFGNSLAKEKGLLAVAAGQRIGAPDCVLFFRQAEQFPIAEFMGHDDCIAGLELSRDGRMLVTGSTRGSVKIWDVDAFIQSPHSDP